jgi:hypothetical protein
VTFDRPGFQAMLAQVEAGNVAVILTKDLSRLGRNSALTGLYTNFSQSYEAEQKQLEAETVTLRQEIKVQEQQNEQIEKFIQKAQKYDGIETLDAYALHELVSAIYVEAPDKSSGKRRQHIHIQYDGIGFIPLDELMKEETA